MFNPTLAKPLVRSKLMWDLVSPNQLLENYVGGSFASTMGPTDLTQNPPLINEGKGLESRGRIPSGNATIRNCSFSGITRVAFLVNGVWQKPHADGIWMNEDSTYRVALDIADVDVHDVDGEGIHLEGSWLRITISGSRINSADGDRITIKPLNSDTGQLGYIGPIKIVDTVANLFIDATHVNPADLPKIMASIDASGLTGNVSVTVLSSTGVAISVSPTSVGIPYKPPQGAPVPNPTPAPPAPVLPAIPPDIQGVIVRRAAGDEWHPNDGSPAAATLAGVYSTPVRFAAAAGVKPPVDPRDAQIANLTVQVQQQATVIKAWQAWLATKPATIG